MNDLLIENGDLSLSTTGDAQIVTGPSKIIQDLKNWLMNRLGYNRFHPWAGTGIDDFVGGRPGEKTNMTIKRQIEQALSTYYAKQFEELRKRISVQSDAVTAMSMAQPDSIVESWKDVIVTNAGPYVRVTLGFRTVAGSEESFSLNIVNASDVTSLMVATANSNRVEEFNR